MADANEFSHLILQLWPICLHARRRDSLLLGLAALTAPQRHDYLRDQRCQVRCYFTALHPEIAAKPWNDQVKVPGIQNCSGTQTPHLGGLYKS